MTTTAPQSAQTIAPAEVEKPFLSVVSPVYGCRNCLAELVRRVEEACKVADVTFEVILVDDCGPDDPWPLIESLAEADPRVRGIKLSRNFGQHPAIFAGLHAVKGEWVVVMDCDLQDNPDEIPRLIEKTKEGADVILAQRQQRTDNMYRRGVSSLFYKTLSFLTDSEHDESIANFGIYHSRVIKQLNSWDEQYKYFPTFIRWLGFKVDYLPVQHQERFEGKSAYNLKRLIGLALSIILSFSDKPLRIISIMGLGITGVTFFAILYAIGQWIFGDVEVQGWTSLILSVWFFGGLTLFTLGLVGIYLGRTLDEAKGRPMYVVDKVTDQDQPF